MLSDYQKELGEKLGVKYGGEKLCLTLNDKDKYVLHYRNLKQYLELGLKLKKFLVKLVRMFGNTRMLRFVVKNLKLRKLQRKKNVMGGPFTMKILLR